jgi:hypothetical protein
MNYPSNPTVRAAGRTASVIGTVKVLLITVNLLASVGLVITGILAKPSGITPAITEDGLAYSTGPSNGTALWWLFVLFGVVSAVVNSLLIFAILGWFEHMLRVSSEHLALAATPYTATPGPLGDASGSVRTVPMNYPLATDR